MGFVMALPLGLLAALSGCRAPQALPDASATAPPPPAQSADDSVYDWHTLIVAPFGSSLKSIPGGHHEVLLFRDDAHGGASDDAECYSPDAAPPSFIGRPPEEFLICFKHDRLARIQASVHLPAEQAQATFAAACAAWLRRAAPGGPHDGAGCEGRDGDVRFSGRLTDDSGLSITLDGADGAPDP